MDDIVAPYLACRHLEQNGLYHPHYADEGHNLHDSSSPWHREAQKVQARSGAMAALDTERRYTPHLFETLSTLDCIVENGGEVSLKTGYWRYNLADRYGYNPILREGGYSVPSLYVPSINLATETYVDYATGGVRRAVAVDAIVSTTRPAKYVNEADRLFDERPASEQTMLRVLYTKERFTTAVKELQKFAASKDSTILSESCV